MHELTLVQSVLDIVEDYRKKYKFKKVNSITLEFGSLTCVNEEALKFAFDTFSKGTIAEKSKLIFRIIPPQIYCNSCKKESTVKEDFSKCPICNSQDIILIKGTEELRLIEMDVDN